MNTQETTKIINKINELINKHCQTAIPCDRLSIYNALMGFKYRLIGYLDACVDIDALQNEDNTKVLTLINEQNIKIDLTSNEIKELENNIKQLKLYNIPFEKTLFLTQNKFMYDYPLIANDFKNEIYNIITKIYFENTSAYEK